MRPILPFLSLLIFYSSCKAQSSDPKDKPKSDLAQKNLKGKIKSLIETRFNTVEKFGEPQKGSLIDKNSHKYNLTGNEIEFVTYGSDGKIESNHTTKYDNKGNKIEVKDYDMPLESNETITYKYDSKNNLIEEVSSNDKKTVYKYNSQNRLIDKSEFNKYINGFKLVGKDTYKYDEKGNQIEFNSYNGDGSLRSKTLTKYDNTNNTKEWDSYSSDGTLNSKSLNKYDEKSNLLEIRSYNFKGNLDNISTMKYNEFGIMIEMNTGLEYKEFYKYDNNGNEIEYSAGGNKKFYQYTFDKMGNWIKQTEFENNKPTLLIERIIEYY